MRYMCVRRGQFVVTPGPSSCSCQLWTRVTCLTIRIDASYAAHVRTMIRYHHDHAIPPGHGIVMLNVQAAWVVPQNRGQLYSPLFPGPRSPRPLAGTRGTTVCCTISEMGGCRLHGSPPQLVPDCPAMKYTLHSSQPWSPAGSLSWHQASTALSQ